MLKYAENLYGAGVERIVFPDRIGTDPFLEVKSLPLESVAA